MKLLIQEMLNYSRIVSVVLYKQCVYVLFINLEVSCFS